MLKLLKHIKVTSMHAGNLIPRTFLDLKLRHSVDIKWDNIFILYYFANERISDYKGDH